MPHSSAHTCVRHVTGPFAPDHPPLRADVYFHELRFNAAVEARKVRNRLLVTWIAIMLFSGAYAFAEESPYRDFETRTIKALSAEQIEQLLGGSGMGLALAAELNHYPGPKHVLELADQLELTRIQREQTSDVYDEMLRNARQLGKSIVDQERTLDDLFATEKVSQDQLGSALDQIAELNARLRFAHLLSHLKMHVILTDEQIDRYAKLRGYAAGSGAAHDPSAHQGH